MTSFIKVANINDFKNKRYKCFKYLSKTVAIIKDDQSFYAIEGDCKHQNASLFSKGLTGDTVTCPRHGWKYNIKTGQCLTHSWASLRRFPLKIINEDIYISPKPQI